MKNSAVNACRRTALLTRLSIFSAALLIVSAVIPAAFSARSIQNNLDINQLTGVWEGSRKLRFGADEDFRLVVESGKAWLQVLGQKNYDLPLTVEKTEGNAMTFRFNSNEARDLEFDKIKATLAVSTARGFSDRVVLRLLAPDNARIPSIMLFKVAVPATESLRIYRSEKPSQYFLYEDWQRRNSRGAVAANDAEAQKHLKQTLARLGSEGGWRCLSQIQKTAVQNQRLSLSVEEGGTDRAYLIYSPNGNARLSYGVGSKPSAYAVFMGTTYDHPVFFSTKGTFSSTTTEIIFKLQPSFTKPASLQQLAVTIFVLGRSPGDYGAGCNIDLGDRPATAMAAPRRNDRPAQSVPAGSPAAANPQPSSAVAPGPTRPVAVAANSSSTTSNVTAPPRTSVAAKGTCDELAAHPEDAGRTGPGVADENIVSTAAIEKCVAAAKQSPGMARFHFQLGRAYWAAKRYDEALDAFLKAEEMNYAPAYFYLARAYEQGIAENGKADPAMARNLYMIAAAEGFAPAIRAYQGDTTTGALDFSEYKQPTLIKALYEGDLNTLNADRRTTISYLKGIYNLLEAEPDFEGADPTCRKLADNSTSEDLTRLARVEILGMSAERNLLGDFLAMAKCGQASGCLDNAKRYEPIVQQGTDDFYLFAYDYGTCEGEAVGKVIATIKRFVRQ